LFEHNNKKNIPDHKIIKKATSEECYFEGQQTMNERVKNETQKNAFSLLRFALFQKIHNLFLWLHIADYHHPANQSIFNIQWHFGM